MPFTGPKLDPGSKAGMTPGLGVVMAVPYTVIPHKRSAMRDPERQGT
ncbi:hypothetical protein [Pseudovibrio japonicus]|nr:hypothetical protein [Pseudovibrio japonicus]